MPVHANGIIRVMLEGILASEMIWSRLVKWLLLRLIELYRRDALAVMPNFWAVPG
jgi:hypothetical protein